MSTSIDRLTEKQKRVFTFVRQQIVDRGYGPTVREIGEHFDIRSPNGVMCHLRALEKKGLIYRSPNKSRAIELTQEVLSEFKGLPMVGTVAAGMTSLAFEQRERVDFGDWFSGEDRFVLHVSGDSMIDAQIADGVFVVVERRQTAVPGDMVVAETPDGEATLKYWYPENGRIRLQPANADMDPIYVKRARVLGVIVGVVRKLPGGLTS